MEAKKSRYNGYTEANARAYKKYMEKFSVIKVRMSDDLAESIRTHCQETGESINSFLIHAAEVALKTAE